MSTQGAASVSAWSTPVHSLAAPAGSVAGMVSAWSIFAWMPLSQKAAMFGLASLFGWMVPQPSSTLRKSDWAGEAWHHADQPTFHLPELAEFCTNAYWTLLESSCAEAL